MDCPLMTGMEFATQKIQIRKEDSLLRYMQEHGIDYNKLYEVEPEEFDCE